MKVYAICSDFDCGGGCNYEDEQDVLYGWNQSSSITHQLFSSKSEAIEYIKKFNTDTKRPDFYLREMELDDPNASNHWSPYVVVLKQNLELYDVDQLSVIMTQSRAPQYSNGYHTHIYFGNQSKKIDLHRVVNIQASSTKEAIKLAKQFVKDMLSKKEK